MLDALAGFLAAVPVLAVLVWQIRLLREALASERARTLELLDRLGTRNYAEYAAVKNFVEPWNEDDLHRIADPNGDKVMYDPTGMFQVVSPAVPDESVD